MKKTTLMKTLISGIFLFCMFFPEILFAQSNKTHIEGFVKDAATGDPLAFASVFFEGTTYGAFTDDKGFYTLDVVKPGKYNIAARYVGYNDTAIAVNIGAGEIVKQNIVLSSVAKTISGVVITAVARGQMKAINTQLASPTIKNVVSEQKIKELPDANAAEALARLPGVSVNRSGGEAVGIKVRGVGANALYVNGMRMDGGLSSISPSMIGSIELSKAFLPDQDADVLGGSVDLKMREATPGFKKEIWFKTGYNGFTKSFKMQDASVLLSNRFFNNKLGVALSVGWDRKDRGRDSYSVGYWTPGSSEGGSEDVKVVEIQAVQLSSTASLTNRTGVTLFTDYKLKNGKLFYQGFFSQLGSENKSSSNIYNSLLTYNSSTSKLTSYNFLNGVSGEHKINKIKVDWGVSYSQNKSRNPNQLNCDFTNKSGMVDAVKTNDTTSINEFMAFGIHNPDKTFINTISQIQSENYSNELAAKLNVEIPYSLTDKINGFIKLGGKYRNKTRASQTTGSNLCFRNDTYERIRVRENLAGLTPDISWVKFGDDNYAASNLYTGSGEEDFSMLGAKTYYFPDYDKVQYVTDGMQDWFGHIVRAQVNDYENTEQFYAGYIMANMNFGKMITFLPGVRYEYDTYSTTARYWEEKISSDFAPFEQQANFGDTIGGNTIKQFFPMVHLKIKPASWFDIRLSYTQTVSRPGFDVMSAKYTKEQGLNTFRGNPKLLPQNNTNYDLYLSFYTGKLGLFTAGAFYKVLENQSFFYRIKIVEPAVFGLPPAYKGKIYDQWINNSSPGYVKGLEFDWQTSFSYLPKPLNGFVLNANLTFMKSDTKYPFYSFKVLPVVDSISGKPIAPFFKSVGKDDSRNNKVIGMPPVVGNISLGYELGGFSGRISVYYQGSTINFATAQNKALDTDQAPLARLDFQASQRLKKVPGLTFYLNLNNITNNPDKTVLTFYPDLVSYEERYGTSGDIGVRYQF